MHVLAPRAREVEETRACRGVPVAVPDELWLPSTQVNRLLEVEQVQEALVRQVRQLTITVPANGARPGPKVLFPHRRLEATTQAERRVRSSATR